MSSYRGTLYTGMTSDLMRRAYDHGSGEIEGFTKRYNDSRLVYYEVTNDIQAAIAREKQIKGWVRRKKVTLIESMNPGWVDLAETWLEAPRPHQTLRPSAKDSGTMVRA